MKPNDAIIEKIRKLMAKANDESTTQEEAAAFAAKVQELLVSHNIDLSSVVVDEKDESISEETVPSMYSDSWRVSLAAGVAKLYFCGIYITRVPHAGKMRKAYVFVGKEHNRLVAISMFKYLEKTAIRLSYNYSKDQNDQYHFQKGCGFRLANRCMELRHEQECKMATVSGASNALTIYGAEEKLVRNYLDALNLKKGRRSSINLRSTAAQAGTLAANSVSLNTQITKQSSKFMLK